LFKELSEYDPSDEIAADHKEDIHTNIATLKPDLLKG
jgi:hypothetical protein